MDLTEAWKTVDELAQTFVAAIPRFLLAIVLADDPDEIAESLAIACADPEAAMRCFQTLAVDLNKGASRHGI